MPVDQQCVADRCSPERAGRKVREGRPGTPTRQGFVGPNVPTAIVEVTADVLVADELADVLDGGEVGDAARVDELRAVVGEDRRRRPCRRSESSWALDCQTVTSWMPAPVTVDAHCGSFGKRRVGCLVE